MTLGGQTQERVVASKWSDCVIAEFAQQADKEKELGLELTTYMIGLRGDEVRQSQLQYGFIENIVLPLWSSFSTSFPGVEFAIDQLIRNRDFFGNRLKELAKVPMTMTESTQS